MTPGKKQELRQLLVKAIASLEIHHSKRGVSLPPVDVSIYKSLLLNRWESQSANSPLAWATFEPKIVDEFIKSKLLDVIREAFAPFIHEDKIQSACSFGSYSPGGGYPLDRLLEQLLKIAIGRGIEIAVLNLSKYTKNKRIPAKSLALLEGIRLKTRIQVSDEIQLIPLPNSPSDLPKFLPTSTYNSFGISPNFFCSKTLLVIDYFVSPAFYHPRQDTAIHEYRTQENRTSDVFKSLCQGLSLACDSAVQASLKWPFWPEDELFYLNPPGPGPPRFSVPVDVFEASVEVEQSQIREAKRLYKILDKNPEVSEKLRVPINRWVKSKTLQAPIDKIIDLVIALEALYVTRKDKIERQLCHRASWYLGENEAHREEIETELKAVYQYRSDIVHSRGAGNKVEFGERCVPVTHLVNKTQDICRISILKIIEERRIPDWGTLRQRAKYKT